MTILRTIGIMTTPACLRRVALAVAVWAIVAPACALAQDADTPPPGTVVLGPLRIAPSMTLTDMGIDNNVKNESTDPKSDFTFTLTPRLGFLLRVRRLRASFDLATDYVYFETYKEEGGLNTVGTGRLAFDFGRLQPFVTLQGTDTQARANAEIDARARHHDTTYGGGLSLLVASRTKVLASGSRTSVDYASDQTFRGTDLATSFDGHRDTVDTGLGFELTPFTTLDLTVGRDWQRFSLSPDRNSDSWRVGPALRFSPDGLVTGGASIGYRSFHALSPALPDYTGFTAAVNVNARIYARHQVHTIFTRDVQYSYEEATQYYIGTTVGVTWTTVVYGPLDVRGTGTHTMMNYDPGSLAGDAGHDTFNEYGGGIGYRVTPQARLGFNVDWSRRESDRAPERNYRNHRFFFGLTWGVRT